MKNLKRFFAFIMCFAILSGLASCGKIAKQKPSFKSESSLSDKDWQEQTKGNTVLKNGFTEFVLNNKNGSFMVRNRKNSTVWYSSVKTGNEEEKHEANSEIVISYFDINSRENKMYSSENALKKGSIRVLSNGEAVRVYYDFRLEETPPFVPSVLSGEMFSSISKKLAATDMFKFKLMYSYYAVDSVTTDAQEVRKKYPYAEKNDIYILKNGLSQSDELALSQMIESIGYTNEEYLKELEEINLKPDEGEIPLGYCIPVEYSLTDEGFSATILNDKITSANEEYMLYSVSLLPYLNCGTETFNKGFIFVPDGSGGEIDISIKDDASYSQRIYGADLACIKEQTSLITQTSVLPVFGFSSDKGAMLASIDSAEAVAKVNAFRSGKTNKIPHVFAEFCLRAVDDYDARNGKTELSVLSKEICAEFPKVNYFLLDEETTSMEMAQIYGEYLLQRKMLKTNASAEKLNIYLEFTGFVTTKDTFLGVPYEKKVVLSKLSSIIESIKDLSEDGVENIYVRLKGFSHNGLYNSLNNDFYIDKNVGTYDELLELADILNKNGGGLFLENNIFEVYKDSSFDGFSSSSDALRRLDKTQGYTSDYDLISLEAKGNINPRYLISPARYLDIGNKYIESFLNKVKSDNIGFSNANAGKVLLSEFDSNVTYDRTQTEKTVCELTQQYAKQGSFMTDVGNMYILKYAQHVLNTPMADSNYSIVTTAVPFLQNALKGCVSVAGKGMNSSEDGNRTKYQTLVSGSNPYWSCVTEGEALASLKGTQTLMPLDLRNVKDDIKSFYSDNKAVYEIHRKNKIVSYSSPRPEITEIVFSNNSSLIFNKTDSDVTYGKIKLSPYGYFIKEG